MCGEKREGEGEEEEEERRATKIWLLKELSLWLCVERRRRATKIWLLKAREKKIKADESSF